MKRFKFLIPFLIIVMVSFSACSSETEDASASTSVGDNTTATQTTVTSSNSTVEVDAEFSDRDLDPSYDESSPTQIALNGDSIAVSGSGATAGGQTLTINSEGVYFLTGTLTDGQIIVAASDSDKIQIVLNDVTINCNDQAPIYIQSADKVFITLNENNTLTDGSSYTQIDENTVDAVIFSKADLTLNGSGTLNITANYDNAIVSKDDLVITGGTYDITTANKGLNGKDCVKINDGVININAPDGKGISSQNDEDSTKGYVYIAGGTINVSDSTEGIEGVAIVITDGDIDLVSSDDGLNAASPISDTSSDQRGGGMMENDSNAYILIAGGTIKINALGDGIDSNGSLYISGGTVYVSGPTNNGNGALDYNTIADITGGTVVIVGSTGMAQSFSDTSTQYSLLYNLNSSCSSGTEVQLTNISGNIIASYTPEKNYQSVVISSPDLADGETYTLTCGSQSAEITLSGMVTSNGQSGGMEGGQNGTSPDAQMPQHSNRPDNGTQPDQTSQTDLIY